jgi:hypothetical protein
LEKQLKSTWVRKQSKLDSKESPTLGPHKPPTLNTLYLIPQTYSLSTPITYLGLPTPTKHSNTRSNRAKKPIPPVLDSYDAIINLININPELKECNPTKLRTLKFECKEYVNKKQGVYSDKTSNMQVENLDNHEEIDISSDNHQATKKAHTNKDKSLIMDLRPIPARDEQRHFLLRG